MPEAGITAAWGISASLPPYDIGRAACLARSCVDRFIPSSRSGRGASSMKIFHGLSYHNLSYHKATLPQPVLQQAVLQ